MPKEAAVDSKILVVYRSVTGFTRQYAQWISDELGCDAVPLNEAKSRDMTPYETVIFGGRFHAGRVDGLKEAKDLFGGHKRLIIFATGATPNSASEMIDEAWKNNFSPDELASIPHFYMQAGVKYEQMPLGDRLMMKVFASMVKRKKDKNEYEALMEKALKGSFDISSKEYIKPLTSYVKSK